MELWSDGVMEGAGPEHGLMDWWICGSMSEPDGVTCRSYPKLKHWAIVGGSLRERGRLSRKTIWNHPFRRKLSAACLRALRMRRTRAEDRWTAVAPCRPQEP